MLMGEAKVREASKREGNETQRRPAVPSTQEPFLAGLPTEASLAAEQASSLLRPNIRPPEQPPVADSSARQSNVEDMKTSFGSPVVSRYKDAFRVAAVYVGLGYTIKGVGILLAGIAGIGIMAAVSMGEPSIWGFLGAIFIGAMVFVPFWVFGIIITAQGQMLRAALDSAVAASPFMTNEERAVAMGLPIDAARHAAAK
jgi:hypothetical protein